MTLIFFIIPVLILMGYSFFIERRYIETTFPEIRLKCLPEGKEGKIVHISDLHFNAKTSKAWIKEISDKINVLNSKVIFITGDLIDNKDGVKTAGEFVKSISQNSKVYIVFGNWDYYVSKYDISELKKELENNGAQALVNYSSRIKIGDMEIWLIGVKDPFTSNNIQKDLEKSMADIPKDDDTCKILLAHSPDIIKYAAAQEIDLVLSGHTHGGQIYIPFLVDYVIPVKKESRKYLRGVYQKNGTKAYVNRGIGTSTLPFRFLARPEITFLTLAPEND